VYLVDSLTDFCVVCIDIITDSVVCSVELGIVALEACLVVGNLAQHARDGVYAGLECLFCCCLTIRQSLCAVAGTLLCQCLFALFYRRSYCVLDFQYVIIDRLIEFVFDSLIFIQSLFLCLLLNSCCQLARIFLLGCV